jgi:hypothetical protein
MTRFHLRAGVNVRGFGDCAIVLDVPADRYWHVPAPLHATLLAIADGCGSIDPAHIPHLRDRLRLIAEGGEASALARRLPEPETGALEGGSTAPRVRARTAATVWARTIGARLAVASVPLERLLASVALSQVRSEVFGGPAADPAALAREFRACRGLLPLSMRCLPDTLAFIGHAHMRGYPARLVFGVQAHPFAAHCWAQHGDLVLNDFIDHARAFRPILVV